MSQASLKIKLIEGKELASKDYNGYSDPFMVIKIADFRCESKVLYKTLNPVWNEEFHINPNLELVPTFIRLVCWDKDRVSKDYMGEVKIDLVDLFQNQEPILFDSCDKEGRWYELGAMKEGHKVKGSIRFCIGWSVEGEEQSKYLLELYSILTSTKRLGSLSLTTSSILNQDFTQSDASTLSAGESSFQPGILILDIKSASDLPYDSNITKSTFDMDPFVVVSLGKESYRTDTKNHTLNPKWSNRIVLTTESKTQNPNWMVKFSIYDYDSYKTNDFIGSASIKLGDLIRDSLVESPILTASDSFASNINNVIEDDVLKSQEVEETPIREAGIDINIKNPTPKTNVDNTYKNEGKSGVMALGIEDNASLSGSNSSSYEDLTSLDTTQTSNNKGKLYLLDLDLAKAKWTEKHKSKLLIRVQYKTQEQVRRKFWTLMAQNYDSDNNGSMNRTEITTMFDSLEAELSDSTIDEFFLKHGKDPLEGEIEISDLVKSLESFILRSSRSTTPTNGSKEEKEQLVTLIRCPFCSSQLPAKDSMAIFHLSKCISITGDNGDIHRLVMGNFITETHAQKKWITKLKQKISHGAYKLGENNANILVQNRKTGTLEEEKMPVYIRVGIRLLYKAKGSTVEYNHIKATFKSMTIKQGIKYNSKKSRSEIKPFIAFHKLNIDEILDSLDSFKSFNEFFFRKLKPEARSLSSPNPKIAVSPADCRANVFQTLDIAKDLWVKAQLFSLAKLFSTHVEKKELDSLKDCSMAIFRLAPQDYHRFHIPVDGLLSSKITKVEGQYYTVNPMAIRSHLDVYGENTRVVCHIDSPTFGRVYMVCVGAMMVGSIIITATQGQEVKRGQELGYFAFGGSTVLLFFPPNKIKFDEDLIEMGNSIGSAT